MERAEGGAVRVGKGMMGGEGCLYEGEGGGGSRGDGWVRTLVQLG